MAHKIKTICLAGGCFWGVEAYFSNIAGIIDTVVGYANGQIPNPTYEAVCSGNTGFAEAVMLKYNSDEIILNEILYHFFDIINPTTLNRQGPDIGTQYRTGIYYSNDEDKDIIYNFMQDAAKKYNNPIVVEVEKLSNFYNAEAYHQKYLKKNPNGYCHIDLSKIKKRKS